MSTKAIGVVGRGSGWQKVGIELGSYVFHPNSSQPGMFQTFASIWNWGRGTWPPMAASSGRRIDRPWPACQLDEAAQQESLKNKTVLGHPAVPFQKSNCTRPPCGRTVYFDFRPRPPPSVPHSIIDWIGLGSDSVKLSKKTVEKNVYFLWMSYLLVFWTFILLVVVFFVRHYSAFPVIIFSNTIHKKNEKGFFSTKYCTQTKTIPICDDAFTTLKRNIFLLHFP